MSDKFSRNLTISLLVFLILYYKYVRFIINQKGEYNQNKCEPLNLLIGGIIGSASDDLFEKCAQDKTNGIVESEFNSYADDVNQQLNETNNYMKSVAAGTEEQLDKTSADYLAKQAALQGTAEDASDAVKLANASIQEGSGILSDSVETITKITTKIENAFKNFINSNPIKKL